jgi:predicted TIM-barrel fold metal-dependent hydrolase
MPENNKEYFSNNVPFVNVHCHFMNQTHISDDYTKFLIKNNIPDIVRLFIGIDINTDSEQDILNHLQKSKLVGSAKPQAAKWARSIDASDFWHENGTLGNYMDFNEYLSHSDKNNLKDSDINLLKNNTYSIITPLMMDMLYATKNIVGANNPSFGNIVGITPYILQLTEYSYIAAKYPWRIFPFVAFSPKRPESLEICKKAVNEMGFIGIKMYPAHGYSPDPFGNLIDNGIEKIEFKDLPEDMRTIKSIINNYIGIPDQEIILERFFKPEAIRLIKFFIWANEMSLPITSHCQYISMQNLAYDYDHTVLYNAPNNWKEILKTFPNIRVNFAHFGGDGFAKIKTTNAREEQDKIYADNFRNIILELFNEHNAIKPRIFADLSAHSIVKKGSKEDKAYYLSVIKSLIKSHPDSLMFGTDTPAITMDMTDAEYKTLFFEMFPPDQNQNLYSYNALKFLFGENIEIPAHYLAFLQKICNDGLIRMPKNPFNEFPNWAKPLKV